MARKYGDRIAVTLFLTEEAERALSVLAAMEGVSRSDWLSRHLPQAWWEVVRFAYEWDDVEEAEATVTGE